MAIEILLNRDEAEGPGVIRRFGAADAASRIVVINGRGRAWQARSAGCGFSVKTAPRGRVRYGVERADHRLQGPGALLVNSGQPYDMAFEAEGETFCLFWSDDLVAEAWAAGDPFEAEGREAVGEFPNLVFRPDAAFGRAVASLHADVAEDTIADLEARLLDILAAAVATAKRHRGQAARAPAARASTRRHILARLEVARALIEGGEAANLDQVARACGLSKFHLVRLFRAVFDCTPMKYAERVRLDRAAQALRSGRRLIDEVAFEAGYETAAAFGRAFRRRHGAPPSAFRSI